LHNAPFCPITASGSNFNPRNTQCIPAVKIIAFLVLGQNWTFFKGLNVCRTSNPADGRRDCTKGPFPDGNKLLAETHNHGKVFLM